MTFNIRDDEACPRCGAPRLRTWRELTTDEREVARRLSRQVDEAERHRASWCTRCWYEQRDARPLAV